MAQAIDRAFDRLMSELSRVPGGDRARVPALLSTYANDGEVPHELRALLALRGHLVARGGVAELLQLAASLGPSSGLGEAALRWADRRWRAPWLLRLGAPPLSPPGAEPAGPRARPLELGPIEGGAALPRSSLVLALSGQGAAVWDAATGARRLELGPASACAVFPSGNDALLAAGPEVRRVVVPAGKQRWQITASGDVRAMAVRGDGGALAVATADGLIELREATRGRRLKTLEGHAGAIGSLAFSPDGLSLAAGGSDGVVRVWGTERGTVETKIEAARLWGYGGKLLVGFSPDGRSLLAVAAGEAAGAWELPSLEPIWKATLRYHDRAAIDALGRLWLFAVGAEGREARLELRAPRGEVLGALSLTREAEVDLLIPLGNSARALALGRGGQGFSYAIEPGEASLPLPERAHQGPIEAVSVSASGERVVTAGRRAGPGQSLEVRAFGPRADLFAEVAGVAASADGLVLSSDGAYAITWSRLDTALSAWGLRPGVRKHTRMLGHEGRVLDVAMLPDGKRLVSGGRDGTIRLWEAAKSRPLAVFGGGESVVERLAPHPDGARVAEIGRGERNEASARIWCLETGRLLAEVESGDERATAIAFSAGGVLLTGGDDGRLRAWNADGGSCVLDIDACPGEPLTWVGFAGRSTSPLSASPRELIAWDVLTGEPRARVALGGRSFRVDPSGRLVAVHGSAASPSRTLAVHDLASGALLCSWQSDAPIISCSFGPDGLIVAGDDRGELSLLRVLPDGSDALTLLEAPATSTTRARKAPALAKTSSAPPPARARSSRA